MLYERMLSESKLLEKKIKSLKEQIEKLPEGDFFCTHNGKYYKWYQTDGKTQIYLPKKEQHLAEQLVTKKYLVILLNELIAEKNAINLFLKKYPKNPRRSESLFANHPEYQKLLSSTFTQLSKESNNWANLPYERNPKCPNQLIHKSISGNKVRSKSEALIDMMLFVNKIPFRYECALSLGDSIIFPDFTIKHPYTNELYYWEHFGRMDDPSYSRNVFSKLNLYTTHKIIPSVRLITTYETKDSPLSSDMIEKIIEYYFN